VVVAWTDDQVQRLWQALESVPPALITTAGVRYIFTAQNLQRFGVFYDGLAYEFADVDEPKWVSLHVDLFTAPGEQEPSLGVPWLTACLLEEVVHVWDFRLEVAGSPYASSGVEWLRVECTPQGRIRPFAIPNRKDYDRIAEDWASAVLWYVWQPDELRRCSPQRHAFVERLFARYRIS
jgi:hypothetical protein